MEPHLLLTRPPEDSARLLNAVEQRLGRAVPHVISPLLRIEPVDADPPEGTPILTSAHGARRAAELGLTGRAWCVGARTADVANRHGFDAISADGAAEDLIRLLKQSRPEGPLVHIRGRHTTGNIAGQLTKNGLRCTSVIAYDQCAEPLSETAHLLLTGENPVVLPLFSARTLRLFLSVGPGLVRVRPVVMSNFLAYEWPGPTVIASEPSLSAMVVAICEVIEGRGSG